MTRLIFDHNRFGDFMVGRKDIKVHDSKNHGWNERDDKAMHYKGDDYEYRTWWHSFSQCRKDAAILVSCKIDQRRSILKKDDHMIIMASVNREGAVIAVQAAMQSIDHGTSGHTDIIINDHTDTGVRLKNAVHKSIDEQLGKKTDKGYRYFGEIAWTNIQCLAASCVLK
jgi:hypothetical protein